MKRAFLLGANSGTPFLYVRFFNKLTDFSGTIASLLEKTANQLHLIAPMRLFLYGAALFSPSARFYGPEIVLSA